MPQRVAAMHPEGRWPAAQHLGTHRATAIFLATHYDLLTKRSDEDAPGGGNRRGMTPGPPSARAANRGRGTGPDGG